MGEIPYSNKPRRPNLDVDLAHKLTADNPDYHTQDLFNAIENNDIPTWTMYVQIMPLQDAETYRFHPFDVTKVWSQKDYPLIEVGRLVLNRNPENYFAEVEQITLSPGNLVPGIEPSPDKMLQGRLFAYADAHRYRVGTNHNLLPINRPVSPVNNNQRDGLMRSDNNGGSGVYYEPNSYGGATESHSYKQAPFEVAGNAESVPHDDNDHYTQAGNLYQLMSVDERTRLVQNIVGSMKPVEKDEIKSRQIGLWYKCDKELGERVAQGLGLNVPEGI